MATLPRNRLLRSLAPGTLEALGSQLRLVPLRRNRVLQHSRVPLEEVFFVEDGLVTVQIVTEHDHGDEAAEGWMIGSEGLAGLPVLLGEQASPHRRVVQVPGRAFAMTSAHLLKAVQDFPDLRRVLLRYTHSVLVQTAQTAACNARHPLAGRLARTLLMMSDRLGEKAVPVTHDGLGKLLGVRRASVTLCLRELQNSGTVRVERGQITIVDREALERLTCYCYSVLKAGFERDLNSPATASNV